MMQYAWTSAHMPVLSGIIRKNVKAKPLSGIKLGFCLQLTAETAVLMLGAKALGAKVYASSGNPLTTNDAIAAYLDSTGVDVAWLVWPDISQNLQNAPMKSCCKNQTL